MRKKRCSREKMQKLVALAEDLYSLEDAIDVLEKLGMPRVSSWNQFFEMYSVNIGDFLNGILQPFKSNNALMKNLRSTGNTFPLKQAKSSPAKVLLIKIKIRYQPN